MLTAFTCWYQSILVHGTSIYSMNLNCWWAQFRPGIEPLPLVQQSRLLTTICHCVNQLCARMALTSFKQGARQTWRWWFIVLSVALQKLQIMTPSIGTHSYQFRIHLGEFSTHIFLKFSFHKLPVTAGWTEAIWSEKFTRLWMHSYQKESNPWSFD